MVGDGFLVLIKTGEYTYSKGFATLLQFKSDKTYTLNI